MEQYANWMIQLDELERQRVANATTPWLALSFLFCCYGAIGILLSLLAMPWLVVGWVVVVLPSLFLLAIAHQHFWVTDNWIMDCLVNLVVEPLRWTASALTNVFKRKLYESDRDALGFQVQLDSTPLASFIVMLLIEGAGLGLGYQLGRLFS